MVGSSFTYGEKLALYTRWLRRREDVKNYRIDGLLSENCNLIGRFDFSKNQITGWVQDLSDLENRRLCVCVTRDGKIIASMPVNDRGEVGWRFGIPLDGMVNPQDVLHERIRVVVHDRDGNLQTLPIEGSTQLALINEFISDQTSAYLQINFHEGGNSNTFLGEGWSGQERNHRWAIGMQSTVILPLQLPKCDFVMEILCWPFTAGSRLTAQSLSILVGRDELTRLTIERQSFLKVVIPQSVFLEATSAVIQFPASRCAKSGNPRRKRGYAPTCDCIQTTYDLL